MLATLLYGFGSPWWRSWLGVVMLAQWVSLDLVFAVVLGRRFYDEYWGYEWVAVGAYSALFLTYWALVAVIFVERRPERERPLVTVEQERETT